MAACRGNAVRTTSYALLRRSEGQQGGGYATSMELVGSRCRGPGITSSQRRSRVGAASCITTA